MTGIGIITNPNSKQNRKQPTRGKLLGYIVGQFGHLEITNSIEDLGRVAETFLEKKIEVLAINGGDGTISRTLTAFIRAYGHHPLPKVLVLRGGTMNMLADNLGIRGTPEEILMRMLESESGLRASDVRSIGTLSVGGQFGFLFGNGFVARYLEAFYRRKTGPLGALWLIAKIYLNWVFRPSHFSKIVCEEEYRVSQDGQPPQETTLTVAMMASTVEKIPLGVKVFPGIFEELGKFQFFSLNVSARSLPLKLPLLFLKNRPGSFLGKQTKRLSHLVISASKGKQLYTLDGELFEASGGRLAIHLGPVVQFVVV